MHTHLARPPAWEDRRQDEELLWPPYLLCTIYTARLQAKQLQKNKLHLCRVAKMIWWRESHTQHILQSVNIFVCMYVCMWRKVVERGRGTCDGYITSSQVNTWWEGKSACKRPDGVWDDPGDQRENTHPDTLEDNLYGRVILKQKQRVKELERVKWWRDK